MKLYCVGQGGQGINKYNCVDVGRLPTQHECNAIIVVLDIVHCPVFYLKQRVGDWILSPSSGKNLLSWAQSLEL
jgi:hypothetical protein